MNDPKQLPRQRDLLLPVLKAVQQLGGSASRRQIIDLVIATVDPSGGFPVGQIPGVATLDGRIGWGISYCKMLGLLDHPRRAFYVLSAEGSRITGLTDSQAKHQLDVCWTETHERWRQEERAAQQQLTTEAAPLNESGWRLSLLTQIHIALTPEAFERYVLSLLRLHGMELDHVGGPGDGGLDGFGTAPLGDVLSTTVAVQCKRYEPSASVGRKEVALLQRDARARGAERAVLVTLGLFTRSAREAAREDIPTVELVDGDRLCDLISDKGEDAGVVVAYEPLAGFFEKFNGDLRDHEQPEPAVPGSSDAMKALAARNTVTVTRLLDAGLLTAGETLTPAEDGWDGTVVVDPDGSLLGDDGQRHRSPTAAVKGVTGRWSPPWAFWKLSDGRTLDDLREEYLSLAAHPQHHQEADTR